MYDVLPPSPQHGFGERVEGLARGLPRPGICRHTNHVCLDVYVFFGFKISFKHTWWLWFTAWTFPCKPGTRTGSGGRTSVGAFSPKQAALSPPKNCALFANT